MEETNRASFTYVALLRSVALHTSSRMTAKRSTFRTDAAEKAQTQHMDTRKKYSASGRSPAVPLLTSSCVVPHLITLV